MPETSNYTCHRITSNLELENLVNLDLLDISHNRLTRFRSLMCSPRILRANDNNLASLVINGSKIEKLYSSRNRLANGVDSIFKANFTCLQELTLSQNDIETLEEGAFSKMGNLSQLLITTNPINELSVEAFRGLHCLEELRFSLKSFDVLKPESSRTCQR